MLEALHDALRFTHVAAGAVGLIAFWIPVFAKKGGLLHRRAGMVFYVSTWVVAVTAVVTAAWAVVDPASYMQSRGSALLAEDEATELRFFLALLGVLAMLTLNYVVVARHVLLANRGVRPLRHFPTLILTVLSIFVSIVFAGYGVQLWQGSHTSLGVTAVVVGLVTMAVQVGDVAYLCRSNHPPMAWWIKHMQHMLGAGIAFHTAFFVFGGRRFFGDLPGNWQLVPWIAPGVIGGVAITLCTRHYKRKFGRKAV